MEESISNNLDVEPIDAEGQHLHAVVPPCSEQVHSSPTTHRAVYAFRPPLKDKSRYASHAPDTLVSWSSTATGGNPRTLLRPDQTYHPLSPPATVARCFNGIYEGQLVYQIGKMAPLSPTYSASQVKSPPARDALSDLRLSASQRNRSCYPPSRPASTRPARSRIRPQTAPSSSSAARLYRRPQPLSQPEGPSLTLKPLSQAKSSEKLQERNKETTPQRPASARPVSPSNLKRASDALSVSLSHGLSAYSYISRPPSPSFMTPPIPRSPPPTASELRACLIQTQERGPKLAYKEKLAKMKQLLG